MKGGGFICGRGGGIFTCVAVVIVGVVDGDGVVVGVIVGVVVADCCVTAAASTTSCTRV